MKKRNIIAILASCAAVISIFTACGKKEEGVTNPTVVGTDGKVYEEITEAVTDTEGEAVTDAAGETQVVVVTKPYTTKKAEKEKEKDKDKDKGKEKDNTQAPEENPAAPGVSETTMPEIPPIFTTDPSVETTTTIDDVTKGEGEVVDVPLDSSGKPQQSMKDKIFKDVAKNKAIYMDCAIVTNDSQAFAQNMNMKFYIKGNKVAIEVPLGLQQIRMAYDGKSMNLIFPSAKAYFPAGTADSGYDMVDEMGIWSAISSEEMEYVKTTKVDGYTCETYRDQTGSLAKYYFDSTGNLKRMEIITPEGSSTIFKISAISTSFDEDVFSVPKGYTEFTEENFESMAGMLGIQ